MLDEGKFGSIFKRTLAYSRRLCSSAPEQRDRLGPYIGNINSAAFLKVMSPPPRTNVKLHVALVKRVTLMRPLLRSSFRLGRIASTVNAQEQSQRWLLQKPEPTGPRKWATREETALDESRTWAGANELQKMGSGIWMSGSVNSFCGGYPIRLQVVVAQLKFDQSPRSPWSQLGWAIGHVASLNNGGMGPYSSADIMTDKSPDHPSLLR